MHGTSDSVSMSSVNHCRPLEKSDRILITGTIMSLVLVIIASFALVGLNADGISSPGALFASFGDQIGVVGSALMLSAGILLFFVTSGVAKDIKNKKKQQFFDAQRDI